MIDCYTSKTEEMEQLHDVSGFRVNHSALKDFIGMIKKILCLIWRTPGLKEIPQAFLDMVACDENNSFSKWSRRKHPFVLANLW